MDVGGSWASRPIFRRPLLRYAKIRASRLETGVAREQPIWTQGSNRREAEMISLSMKSMTYLEERTAIPEDIAIQV